MNEYGIVFIHASLITHDLLVVRETEYPASNIVLISSKAWRRRIYAALSITLGLLLKRTNRVIATRELTAFDWRLG